MPGAGFKTFTAGEVFTATDANTYLMQQSVMVFTNEAARDAAITAPSEGMHAYLTAPTIPAATGASTQLPTGIRTVYNGSVWVCTTPIGAKEPLVGTTTSGTYTPTLSAGTNPSVTLVTGTTALISMTCLIYNTGANSTYASIAVSGATTAAASDDHAILHGAISGTVSGRTFVLSGLTAGTNTFTLNYKRDAGTGSFQWRTLVAQGIA